MPTALRPVRDLHAATCNFQAIPSNTAKVVSSAAGPTAVPAYVLEAAVPLWQSDLTVDQFPRWIAAVPRREAVHSRWAGDASAGSPSTPVSPTPPRCHSPSVTAGGPACSYVVRSPCLQTLGSGTSSPTRSPRGFIASPRPRNGAATSPCPAPFVARGVPVVACTLVNQLLDVNVTSEACNAGWESTRTPRTGGGFAFSWSEMQPDSSAGSASSSQQAAFAHSARTDGDAHCTMHGDVHTPVKATAHWGGTPRPDGETGQRWQGGASLVPVVDGAPLVPVGVDAQKAPRVNSLVADVARELKALGDRRCEQQLLKEQVLHDETLLQRSVDSLGLKISMCDLRARFLEAAAADAASSTRGTRMRMNATRDDYVATLRRRLVQSEAEIRWLRDRKQKSADEVQGLSPGGAEGRRRQRLAAQELDRFWAGSMNGTVELVAKKAKW